MLHRDFVLLHEKLQTTPMLGNDCVFAGLNLCPGKRQIATFKHAVSKVCIYFFVSMSGSNQCFGGNTADIETCAAKIDPLIDENDFHPQLGCPQRSHLASWPSPNHSQIILTHRILHLLANGYLKALEKSSFIREAFPGFVE